MGKKHKSIAQAKDKLKRSAMQEFIVTIYRANGLSIPKDLATMGMKYLSGIYSKCLDMARKTK